MEARSHPPRLRARSHGHQRRRWDAEHGNVAGSRRFSGPHCLALFIGPEPTRDGTCQSRSRASDVGFF